MKPRWWKYAEFALGLGVTAYKAVTCALWGHDYVNASPYPRRVCLWCGKEKRWTPS